MSIIRTYRRNIAKAEMKKDGMVRFCKHSYGANYNSIGRAYGITKISSNFSQNWRTYKGGE